MHGIIFFQFNNFFVKKHGINKWTELLTKAELDTKLFIPTKVYPDHEFKNLVVQAAQLSDQTHHSLLQEFGEYIVQPLLKVYAAYINKNWSFFDLLENTENTMHRAVRLSDKNADPPSLGCKRISPNCIQIEYASKRNMVDFGIGIINGLAIHYNESIYIKKLESKNGITLEIGRKNKD